MRRYRVTLEIPIADDQDNPDLWNWQAQLGTDEPVTVTACQALPEDMTGTALAEPMHPGLANLLWDEWGNYHAMVREARAKGREMPPEPTLASLADSLAQMPDDIVTEITAHPAAQIRQLLEQAIATVGAGAPMPEPVPNCSGLGRHAGPFVRVPGSDSLERCEACGHVSGK